MFNIAGPKATSHDDAADAISKMFNVPKIMVRMPMGHHLELDIDAVRTLLQFSPQLDFQSTIRTALTGVELDYIKANSYTGFGDIIKEN